MFREIQLLKSLPLMNNMSCTKMKIARWSFNFIVYLKFLAVDFMVNSFCIVEYSLRGNTRKTNAMFFAKLLIRSLNSIRISNKTSFKSDRFDFGLKRWNYLRLKRGIVSSIKKEEQGANKMFENCRIFQPLLPIVCSVVLDASVTHILTCIAS